MSISQMIGSTITDVHEMHEIVNDRAQVTGIVIRFFNRDGEHVIIVTADDMIDSNRGDRHISVLEIEG